MLDSFRRNVGEETSVFFSSPTLDLFKGFFFPLKPMKEIHVTFRPDVAYTFEHMRKLVTL